MDNQRICLLGVFDELYAGLAGATVNDNWRRYADRHGYAVKAVKVMFPQTAASWYKIFHLRETLKTGRHDWVCYFDTDILFTNHEQPLTSFLDDRSFLAVADDVDETGEFIGAQLCVRHCQEAIEFLDEVWEERHRFPHHPWEQPVLNLVAQSDKYKDKIRRWTGTSFHSFWPNSDPARFESYPSSTLFSWFPGSFTCHATPFILPEKFQILHRLNDWLKSTEHELAESGQ